MCKAGQFTTRSFYYKNVSDSEYMILRKKKRELQICGLLVVSKEALKRGWLISEIVFADI